MCIRRLIYLLLCTHAPSILRMVVSIPLARNLPRVISAPFSTCLPMNKLWRWYICVLNEFNVLFLTSYNTVSSCAYIRRWFRILLFRLFAYEQLHLNNRAFRKEICDRTWTGNAAKLCACKVEATLRPVPVVKVWFYRAETFWLPSY